MALVGKVEATKQAPVEKKKQVPKEANEQPNSIHNVKNETVKEKAKPKKDEFGFTIVKEPALNNIKIKAGVDGARNTVDALAEQYKSTRADIVKANNLKDINKIKTEQELIIPSKTGKAWDAYNAYQDKYDNACYEAREKLYKQEQAKIFEENKIIANGKIAEAKEKGLDKKYEFSVDKQGNVAIILKNQTEVDEIVDDFKLKPGILRTANGDIFGTEIKREEYWHGLSQKPYNDSEAKAGLKFIIPSKEIDAGKTVWEKLFGN